MKNIKTNYVWGFHVFVNYWRFKKADYLTETSVMFHSCTDMYILTLHYCDHCTHMYRSLTMARQGVSHGGLGVLAKHRKRQRLNSVLLTLRTLKTLVSISEIYIFWHTLVLPILISYVHRHQSNIHTVHV